MTTDAKMQRIIYEVRRNGHDRLGEVHLEAAARALPTNCDTKFCRDAVTTVDLLIHCEVAELRDGFTATLHSDEKRDVEFVRTTRALQTARDSNRVLERANALWSDFARRCAYGMCRRQVQERRNAGAREIWKDYIDGLAADGVRSWSKLEWCVEEATYILQGLAISALPRFLQSDDFDDWRDVAEADDTDDAAALVRALGLLKQRIPANIEGWLGMFVSMAEHLNVAVAVADVCGPGAPLVYGNPEFSRATGFSSAEFLGRNCRFLQGPGTEPEAVDVLREALASASGAHVMLTNYRKNLEPFTNLLTLTPVYDYDRNYRFVVAVQFEVNKSWSVAQMRRRLVSLGRLLRSLPLRRKFSSADFARTMALRAPRQPYRAFAAARARSLGDSHDGHPMHFSRRCNYLFTRALWLAHPAKFVEVLLHYSGDIGVLLRRFVVAECASLARSLLSVLYVTSRALALAGDGMAVPAASDALTDDDLGTLALFCDEVRRDFWEPKGTAEDLKRVQAREKRPSHMRRSADLTEEEGEGGVLWAVEVFEEKHAPQRPAASRPTRTKRRSRTAPGTPPAPLKRTISATGARLRRQLSTCAGETPRWKVGKTLGDSVQVHVRELLDGARRSFIERSLADTRRRVTECLVDLVLWPLLSSTTGLRVVEELCEAETGEEGEADYAAHVSKDRPAGVGPTTAVAVCRDPQENWLDFCPSICASCGDDVGFCVSDLRSPGLPLVYVSRGFSDVTGYSAEEAIGRNCRFLQRGKKRDDRSQPFLVEEIAADIRCQKDGLTALYNYNKNGDRYKCVLVLAALRDDVGVPAYALGFQIRISNNVKLLGQALLVVDAVLRRTPRSTSCHDSTWVNVGATSALERAPLALACWLSSDANARSDRHAGGPQWRACLDAVLGCARSRKALLAWAVEGNGDVTVIGRHLLRFVTEIDDVMALEEGKRERAIKTLLCRSSKNVLYYFSNLEIPYGSMDRMDLEQALDLLRKWREELYPYLAKVILPSFLGEPPAESGSANAEYDGARSVLADVARTLMSKAHLEAEDHLLSVALEDAPVALLILDDSLSVSFANRAFRSLASSRGSAESPADLVPTEIFGPVRNRDSAHVILLPDAFKDAPSRKVPGPGLCLAEPIVAMPGCSLLALCGCDGESAKAELEVVASLFALVRAPPNAHHEMKEAEAHRVQRYHRAGDIELAWARVSNRKLDRHLHPPSSPKNQHSHRKLERGGHQHSHGKLDRGGQIISGRNVLALPTSLLTGDRFRMTASGAKSPALLDPSLPVGEKRKQWSGMGFARQRRVLFEAIEKVKAEESKMLAAPSRDSLISTFETTRPHHHKRHPDAIEHEKLAKELDAQRVRFERAKHDLKRHQTWEGETLRRFQEREMEALEQRHLDEAQNFVDKVAENASAWDGTTAGAINKQKFIRCACKNPYTCTHNRNALCVVETPGIETAAGLPPKRDNEAHHNAKVAETMLNLQTRAREALVSKHVAARETALERGRVAEKVMGLKFAALITKCAQRAARCERKLLIARQRNRVHRLGGALLDDGLGTKVTPFAHQNQAVAAHYLNKSKRNMPG